MSLAPALLVASLLALAGVQRLVRGSRAATALGLAAGVATVGLAAGSNGSPTQFAWLPELGIVLSWKVDALAATLLGLVGFGLIATTTWAAGASQQDRPRLLAGLTAFCAAMTGLLSADNLLTLFVFWELTTLCSYALIGFDGTSAAARRAARTSLLVTGAGGLALLAGAVLTDATTVPLADLGTVLDPTESTTRVALFLLLAAAMTKSAQVPFHGWLTGAGTAPTAASALLHAATLVVGGVYLVLRLAPVGRDVPGWSTTALFVGLTTYAWSHWGSRRATDAKAMLAGTTAAQMGLAFALAGLGSPEAAVASVAVLLVHGAYKSGLFLVVGTVSATTGAKAVDDIAPAAARHRGLRAALVLGAVSMAGLPPAAGWVAKEAGAAALVGTVHTAALLLLVVGTALGVAVAVRLVRPTRPGTPALRDRISPIAAGVPLALGALALFAGPWSGGLGDLARSAAAVVVDNGTADVKVTAWPGPSPALAVSLIALLLGAGLATLDALRPPRRAGLLAPGVLADAIDAIADRASRLARRLERLGRQAIVGTVLAGALAFLWPRAIAASAWPQDLPLAANSLQLLAIAAIAFATLGILRTRQRFTAAVFLGVIGFGVAGLFLIHGAPDLVLTQVVVETVVVVAFAGVLRRLGRTARQGTDWLAPETTLRLGLAVTTGLLVGDLAISLANAPASTPVADAIVAESVPSGGGTNAVNVVLTDFRALDTAGELIVLFLAAAGSLGIARAKSRHRTRVTSSTADGRRLPAVVATNEGTAGAAPAAPAVVGAAAARRDRGRT